MFKSLFRRSPGATPFAKALAERGFDHCAYKEPWFFAGMKPGPEGTGAIDHMPAAASRFYFFEAPEQVSLIRSFLSSPEVARATRLWVGSSLDYIADRAGNGRVNHDYSAAIAALTGGPYPAVTSLALGEMWATYNGHPYTGIIGDITPVFDAFPNLQELELFGQFTLTRPVQHARLERLDHTITNIGYEVPPTDQQSVDHLLRSDFPALTGLDLDLADEDDGDLYDLPTDFAAAMPALRRAQIACLTPKAAGRLQAWNTRRG